MNREQTDPNNSFSKVVLCIYDDFSQDGLEVNGLLREKIEEEKKLVPKLPEVACCFPPFCLKLLFIAS